MRRTHSQEQLRACLNSPTKYVRRWAKAHRDHRTWHEELLLLEELRLDLAANTPVPDSDDDAPLSALMPSLSIDPSLTPKAKPEEKIINCANGGCPRRAVDLCSQCRAPHCEAHLAICIACGRGEYCDICVIPLNHTCVPSRPPPRPRLVCPTSLSFLRGISSWRTSTNPRISPGSPWRTPCFHIDIFKFEDPEAWMAMVMKQALKQFLENIWNGWASLSFILELEQMTAQEQARESVTLITKTSAEARAGRQRLHPKRWRTGLLTLDDLSSGTTRATPMCDNTICGQRCAAALITNVGIKQCRNTCTATADNPHANPWHWCTGDHDYPRAVGYDDDDDTHG